ncbi:MULTISPECIES: lipopolysaccharide biosynthesis protein [Olivibacter]|jgi:O-antigen/teichoic acid export membrane protein|uniref:Lipopolysaccharide biosynthesis protein n=1 Tax=Olivibacter oleidegradans TaxID=760123 RepID=A0ABV6HJJ7_9SPHI|nr:MULTISPECIES: lipopolysaccharide biosynthesis protein [Olivibacter]MDM8176741.1 lipopolysaccharide biosynthesis protein [Olivibacter sp. 47]QEL00558.1 lipopolysaccharide biosynthesis protein [Olivibacter sp. LS-1]
MDSSKSLVLKGIFWNGAQLVINQSFAFIVKLILAKLLLPEQFGLIGMAAVFTGFVQVLTDLGFGAALIQRKEEDLKPVHFHTAFWTGLLWSIALFLLMSFVIAPLAVEFYHEERLRLLIPVISLGILFTPINLVNKAQLSKKMEFKKIASIEGAANIVAGILSIILAFAGAGVWSLAFNSFAMVTFAIPFYFKATNWRPKFQWNRQAFKDVFGFGVLASGTNLVNYIINNIDYLLIGKFLSAALLGAYSFAFVLTDLFRSRLMAVINNVMYPLYGKKQSEPAAIKKYYLKVVSYNCIIVFPVMLLFFTLAEPFVLNFFGEKWHASIIPLQILAASIMIQMLVNSNTVLIRALGRPGLEMRLQIIKAVVYIPSLAYGVYAGGIIGASWAVFFNKIFNVIVAQYAFRYLLDLKISTLELLSEVKAAVIGSLIAYGIGFLLLNIAHMNFVAVAIVMVAVFAGVIYKMVGQELMLHLKPQKK